MQLNLFNFCGICQLMPLKVWPNIALGCHHQSACMPNYSLYVQLVRYQCTTPEGWSLGWALCSDRSLIVYWLPLGTQTRATGFKIISGDHYTTTTHSSNICSCNNKLFICTYISKLSLQPFYMTSISTKTIIKWNISVYCTRTIHHQIYQNLFIYLFL